MESRHFSILRLTCRLIQMRWNLFNIVTQVSGTPDPQKWLKNTEQCEELNSLHICFHFGVCFQLCARKYGVPKCGLGCSHVVIWHHLIYRMSLYPRLILI